MAKKQKFDFDEFVQRHPVLKAKIARQQRAQIINNLWWSAKFYVIGKIVLKILFFLILIMFIIFK